MQHVQILDPVGKVLDKLASTAKSAWANLTVEPIVFFFLFANAMVEVIFEVTLCQHILLCNSRGSRANCVQSRHRIL